MSNSIFSKLVILAFFILLFSCESNKAEWREIEAALKSLEVRFGVESNSLILKQRLQILGEKIDSIESSRQFIVYMFSESDTVKFGSTYEAVILPMWYYEDNFNNTILKLNEKEDGEETYLVEQEQGAFPIQFRCNKKGNNLVVGLVPFGDDTLVVRREFFVE